MSERAQVAGLLERQSRACRVLGSGLYAELLAKSADDVRSRGPAWRVLEPYAGEPEGSALALRLMAAVHRLVLTGEAPELARHYPSTGGTPDADVWTRFRSLLDSQAEEVARLTGMPMQTNEVGRCAPLVVGLIVASARSPAPLRLLELGASAGLNLVWDRYHYESGGRSLGRPGSPVEFSHQLREGLPDGPDPVVADRRGCDPSPLDLGSASDRLRLLSSTWADQPMRIERLRNAISLSRQDPPPIDRASAGDWIESRLDSGTQAGATVVFHSIVWQYLDASEQNRILEAMSSFASRNLDHPLHHLAMDRDGDMASLTLTTWPSNTPTVIARTGYHGDPVLLTTGPEAGAPTLNQPSTMPGTLEGG